MRALIQRVSRASVSVDQRIVGTIGNGLCVFVGVTHADDATTAKKLADKIWNLRVFEDTQGLMNRAVGELTGDVLVISQFTLYGNTKKGRRPSFVQAARPETAEFSRPRVPTAQFDGGGEHCLFSEVTSENHISIRRNNRRVTRSRGL